jgi:ribosomal protein L29
MKKTEKKDLRTKTIEELRKILVDKRREFDKTRMEKGAAKIKNTHLLALKRREIATILTVIAEKEFERSIHK